MNIWMLDPAQLTPYYNIALCDALAKNGCGVRYITSKYLYDDALPFTNTFQTSYLYFRGLTNPSLTQYPTVRHVLRGMMYPMGHWQLIRQMRREKPDILHIQWSRLPRFDKWLIREAKALGIPVVHTVHDIVPLYAPESSTEPMQQVYELVDAIIVHAEANRYDFMRTYPRVNPRKIFHIPFINSPYKALPTNASNELARQLLGISSNACVFLFFGSIRHYKGLDVLLEAYIEAQVTRPDIHLIIAGLPETIDDINLLEHAKTLQNCHVNSGYIPYEEMWQYYLAAEVAVLPYRTITQSAALMTAMEFGRAIIVTNVGGLAETIDKNGWVVEAENSIALAKALIKASDHDEERHQFAMQSKALVNQKYSAAAIASQTIELYQSLTRH